MGKTITGEAIVRVFPAGKKVADSLKMSLLGFHRQRKTKAAINIPELI